MNAVANIVPADFRSLERRVENYAWDAIGLDLNAFGSAVLEKLLTANECDLVASLYGNDEHFRSRVTMARHGFGKGEYKYFKYPLPIVIADLRTALYSQIVAFADAWNERMNVGVRYPEAHADYLKLCHDAGQVRPTPLLLRYAPGDFNCLHQDLYGDLVFPFQVTILLSEPNRDFTGGEFVLTEQRPRMQSRAEVVPMRQGDAVLFAVHDRPVQGTKGNYRVNLRHGVSRIRSGYRHTVGIIFHDGR
ncbi:MAG: 2OG-Fe(II) oxygenase [Xanthobacteraceae bacterium]